MSMIGHFEFGKNLINFGKPLHTSVTHQGPKYFTPGGTFGGNWTLLGSLSQF